VDNSENNEQASNSWRLVSSKHSSFIQHISL
jgi:hypothetical protein